MNKIPNIVVPALNLRLVQVPSSLVERFIQASQFLRLHRYKISMFSAYDRNLASDLIKWAAQAKVLCCDLVSALAPYHYLPLKNWLSNYKLLEDNTVVLNKNLRGDYYKTSTVNNSNKANNSSSNSRKPSKPSTLGSLEAFLGLEELITIVGEDTIPSKEEARVSSKVNEQGHLVIDLPSSITRITINRV